VIDPLGYSHHRDRAGMLGPTSMYHVALALLVMIAALLRFSVLDRPFLSQDEVLPAYAACYMYGYLWMISFYSTGGIILFVAWLAAVVLTSLGVAMTEFWWIAPIAMVGTLQAPMTFALSRRLGCAVPAALCAAATMAILPIHVMQSRHALSHEVLAVFLTSAACLALLRLFERPSYRRGLGASFACGLYLVCHHYVVPFAVCFLAMCAFFGKGSERSVFRGILGGSATFARYGGPLFPLLALPVVSISLGYTFIRRLPHPAFDVRLSDFVTTLYQSAGPVIAAVLLVAIPLGLLRASARTPALLFCTVAGAAYLAPLFLSDSVDHHDVAQYSMVGIHFLVLAAALAIDPLVSTQLSGRAMSLIATSGLALTLAITTTTVFTESQSFLALARQKGCVRDDLGIKTAGYFFRRHVPPRTPILALHPHLSRDAATYYLRGGDISGLYAMHGNQPATDRAAFFEAAAPSVEVIVVGSDLFDLVDRDGRFELAVPIEAEGTARAWIFTRPGFELPRGAVRVEDYNERFDREFGPREIPILGRYIERGGSHDDPAQELSDSFQPAT
jgi:hypothetical protein